MASFSSSRVDIGFREAFEAYRWVQSLVHTAIFEIQVKTYCACVIGPHRIVC